jgi:hypothetical protein
MKLRSMMLSGALALSSVALLSAKTYDIVLSAPSQAGSLQLPQGEYRLKLEGTTAVFTNVENGKRFTTPVKLESGPKKFDETAVESTEQNGTSHIRAIELGGSTTQVDFGE